MSERHRNWEGKEKRRGGGRWFKIKIHYYKMGILNEVGFHIFLNELFSISTLYFHGFSIIMVCK